MPKITDDETDSKGQKKKTLICLVSAIVILALATTIGLCLHFLLPRDLVKARTDVVGDCHPLRNGDKSKCEAKGYVFKNVLP